MSAQIYSFTKKAEEKKPCITEKFMADTEQRYVRYETLIAIRYYHQYKTRNKAAVKFLSELLITNLKRGSAFPIVPNSVCEHYVEEVAEQMGDVARDMQATWESLQK